jgi:DNA-binding NarL/FixJ family response regulator
VSVSTSRPISVLLADDHQVVREGMRMILAEAGRVTAGDGRAIEVVCEAANGEEAIREAARCRPDVVLMDLQMPVMDGVQATRRIVDARTAGAILVLTTFEDDVHVRAAVQAGAIGYLLKDVLKEDLVRAIRDAARGTPTLDARAQRTLMRSLNAPAHASPFDALTPRERDVLRLIARGESNKRIAAQLNLSLGTVKGYVSAVLEKLGVADRTGAALFATKHGLAEEQ